MSRFGSFGGSLETRAAGSGRSIDGQWIRENEANESYNVDYFSNLSEREKYIQELKEIRNILKNMGEEEEHDIVSSMDRELEKNLSDFDKDVYSGLQEDGIDRYQNLIDEIFDIDYESNGRSR